MHIVNYYEHASLHCLYSTVRQAMDTPFFNLRLISRLDRVHSLLGHKDEACPDCIYIPTFGVFCFWYCLKFMLFYYSQVLLKYFSCLQLKVYQCSNGHGPEECY